MPGGEEARYISTVQAAEALGVSVSTVKRWVDQGILPADRTAGGHRKMFRAEVLALARQGVLPQHDLSALSSAGRCEQPGDLQAISADLLAAVLRGDSSDASALIRRIYRAGLAIDTLADRLIAPLMAKVGHDWETARIEVWHEHRGTQIVAAALYELKGELRARANRRRPVALGGAPEGDPYVLASLLAELMLLDAGWDAVNLGPNTPLATLTRAMLELCPRLIWLSVSHLEKASGFLPTYRTFYHSAAEMDVAVAVGGRALV